MHGFQLAVIWASMVGSGLAVIINLWACWRLTSWKFSYLPRLALIVSATLAGAYCVSYIWLLFHQTEVTSWSSTMRPVGMMGWFVGPWTMLPVMLLYQGTRFSKRMVTEASNLILEIRGSEEVRYLVDPDDDIPVDSG